MSRGRFVRLRRPSEVRLRRIALLVQVLAALGCAPQEQGPLPRVVSAKPSGSVPPDAVSVEIAFSAAIDPAGIEDGRFFALCRREDLHDVVTQAETEGGLTPAAPIVPARRALLEGGTRAALTPTAPLEPERAWAAIVSRRVRSADGRLVLDPEGRARTFALLFDTGPAADRVAPRGRWMLPPHGPAPANLSAIRVKFDESVSGSLALSAGTAAAAAPVAPAADILGLDLSSPLPPGPLAVDVSAVHDAAGNAAVAIAPLEVSACSSTTAPAIAADVRATPGDLSIEIRTTLAGMGRLVAELSTNPGDPACGIAPASPSTTTWTSEVAPCPGWDPCKPAAAACPATVELRGLCPGQPVRVRLTSEDLAGHRGEPGAWKNVTSLPPHPGPVLTEVLADADSPEAGGEYAEVANLGTGDADLVGYSLAKRSASGSFTRCPLVASAGGPVPPGGHALVVGGSYDGRYPLPAGTPVYRCGATALDGGLANDRAVALALEDPLGQLVSAMGVAEPAPRCTQGSLERIHPGGPDAASNLACPGVRTPGVCNRSTPPEECPRRPW